MLSDTQKSRKLLEAVGYNIPNDVPDLYKIENVELAWYVLNWANSKKGLNMDHSDWWHNFCADFRLSTLNGAQRLWLNRILQICVEMDLVEGVGINL